MIRIARLVFRLLLLLLVGGAIWLWLNRPPAAPPDQTAISGPVDLIRIEKAARRMVLIKDGKELRRYSVALGFTPQGDKLRQGDGKTPEGRFRIDRRNQNSAYHLSLGLDYPQADDRERARKGGHDPGGDIMIHGQPNSVPERLMVPGDWTAGCIALTNAEMREVWKVAPIGTLVEILP